ncbi:MAG: nucleotide pyrophosphohydrolase [Promethearchaeota archaeon]
MELDQNDENTSVSYFKYQVNEFVRKRNWSKYHTPKNLIQALGIEVSELSELFLFKDYNSNDIHRNKELIKAISGEIADIFIYLVSLVNSLSIDLTYSFVKKMEINENKYPPDEFNDGTYYKK